jgi:hypothetical protein
LDNSDILLGLDGDRVIIMLAVFVFMSICVVSLELLPLLSNGSIRLADTRGIKFDDVELDDDVGSI